MGLTGLAGRRALVTGAGRGIGAAIAHRLVSEGVRVAINDLDATAAETLAAEMEGAIGTPGDVANPDQARDIVAKAVAGLGGLDLVVNNAGIEHRASVIEHGRHDWNRVLDVNLSGPFWIVQAACPSLIAAERGVVVNISSIAVMGAFGQPAYDASKGGLMVLSRSLAVELGRHGVRVNSVCPGFTDTEMAATPEMRRIGDATVRGLPIRRWGLPEDVANAVAWLASDESSYITGQTLFVDGGLVRT
ncbi:MAG: SDR family NAD(P)-dependent oxidoreductase [Mycobacteriales bacterium]